MRKEREDFIDVAKGIGITLVIIGHSGIPEMIYKFIYGFHMPLFFIISGFLYNYAKWNQLGFKTLVRKKFKAYIIPYFTLSFLNLFINIPVEHYYGISGVDLLDSTVKHIYWIFYSVCSSDLTPNCSPLWFLPAIYIADIYVYFLFKVKDINKRFLIFLTAIILSIYMCVSRIILHTLPWHIETALIGAIFMYVGYLIKNNNLLHKNVNIWGIITITVIAFYAIYSNNSVSLGNNNIGNPILFFCGAGLMSYTILWICANYIKCNHFFSYFGNHTIFVMGFNYAVNTWYSIAFYNMSFLNNNMYRWGLVCVANIVSIFFITFIWNVIKYMYFKINSYIMVN